MLIHYIVICYPNKWYKWPFCDLLHTFHKQVTNASQHVFDILLWSILTSPLIRKLFCNPYTCTVHQLKVNLSATQFVLIDIIITILTSFYFLSLDFSLYIRNPFELPSLSHICSLHLFSANTTKSSLVSEVA